MTAANCNNNQLHKIFGHRKRCIADWQAYATGHLYPILAEEGLLIKPNTIDSRVASQTIPVTLMPTLVDGQAFRLGWQLQPIWSQLMSDISRDVEFVLTTLNDQVLKDDHFTERLVQLYKAVHQAGVAESYSLSILRGDYMLDRTEQPKLVEMNTISASFAGLAPAVRRFHSRVAVKLNLVLRPTKLDAYLPANESLEQVARALIRAQQLYGHGPNNSIVLVVTEPFLVNNYDVQAIMTEFNRQSRQTITGLRVTFELLVGNVHIGPNKELLYKPKGSRHGNLEVGVVYYRTGYAPEDFVDETWWALRCTIERSRAIKCPNIGMHLAGVKRIQHVLSQEPKHLSRLLSRTSAEEVELVRRTLVNWYNVNEESADMVRQAPGNYVLKPNREGGGHNCFGSAILPKMHELLANQQSSTYGLMEFIHQPPGRGIVLQPLTGVQPKPPADGNIFDLNHQVNEMLTLTSEIGFYGVHLCGRDRVVCNLTAGHIVRTKLSTYNEVGVLKGSGALDSPFIVPKL